MKKIQIILKVKDLEVIERELDVEKIDGKFYPVEKDKRDEWVELLLSDKAYELYMRLPDIAEKYKISFIGYYHNFSEVENGEDGVEAFVSHGGQYLEMSKFKLSLFLMFIKLHNEVDNLINSD